MKNIVLYIDYSDRLHNVPSKLSFVKFERGAQVVKKITTSYSALCTNAAPGCNEIPLEDYHDDFSEVILVILHGNNLCSDLFYKAKLQEMPVIVMSGGSEELMDCHISKENKLHAFVPLRKLQDRLAEFLTKWHESAFSPQSIPFYVFNNSTLGIDTHFRSLDILIQVLLAIKGVVEKNDPWWWDGLNGKRDIILNAASNNHLNDQWKAIQKDPYKWFEECREDMEELFPDLTNSKLVAAIGKWSNAITIKDELLPDGNDSALVMIGKCIATCDPEKANMLLNEELLCKAHEEYSNICQLF